MVYSGEIWAYERTKQRNMERTQIRTQHVAFMVRSFGSAAPRPWIIWLQSASPSRSLQYVDKIFIVKGRSRSHEFPKIRVQQECTTTLRKREKKILTQGDVLH